LISKNNKIKGARLEFYANLMPHFECLHYHISTPYHQHFFKTPNFLTHKRPPANTHQQHPPNPPHITTSATWQNDTTNRANKMSKKKCQPQKQPFQPQKIHRLLQNATPQSPAA
jgi:hypothetical protein